MLVMVPIVVGSIRLFIELAGALDPTIREWWDVTALAAIPGMALIVSHRRALYLPVFWWLWYAAWILDIRVLIGLVAGEVLGRRVRRESPRPDDYMPTDFIDGLVFWPSYLFRTGNPLRVSADIVVRYAKGKPVIVEGQYIRNRAEPSAEAGSAQARSLTNDEIFNRVYHIDDDDGRAAATDSPSPITSQPLNSRDVDTPSQESPLSATGESTSSDLESSTISTQNLSGSQIKK
jgi:hypothetical protein